MRKDIYHTIFREIGGLLLLLGIVFLLPMLVSMLYREWYSAVGFLVSAAITSGIGYVVHEVYLKSAAEAEKKHAMIIVACGWLAVAVMGALPLLLIACITPPDVLQAFVPPGENYSSSILHFRNPLHALFESMSGFTTTGLTMSVHEPSVGKGILFYRSLSQWAGGAGFIVMALAVMQQTPGPTLQALFGTESSGEKFRPTVMSTARAVWKLYLGLTVFQAVYLAAGTYLILPEYPPGQILFDSVNHALTGQSTGGFSTLDNSIASYDSQAMETLYILPMIMGALAIPFYFRLIFKREFDRFWRDIQTRALLFLFVLGGAVLSLLLLKSGAAENAFREGVFQFISALSTTGWQTSTVSAWDDASIVFIVTAAMFIGGATGATVGGIKMRRVLLIQKGLQWQVGKIFFPERMIATVKFDHQLVLPEKMNEDLAQASTMAFIYVLLVLFSTFLTSLFMAEGFTLADAFFESASAQGTIGLSTGITGPSMSPVIESIYIVQMWAGRLEIIPVIILARALVLGTDPRVT